MADGTEYNIFLLKEAGQPVEAVYPTEGTPFIVGPNGVFKAAPNPNAAKLFQNYCFTPEAQQIIIEVGGLRSLHAAGQGKAGPQTARRHQADEGRRGGRRKAERRNQGALSETVSRLIGRHERSEASLLAMTREGIHDAKKPKPARRS